MPGWKHKERERQSKRWGISESVEEQPSLLFFSSPSVLSKCSRGREGGELGRRSMSLRSSPLAP